MVEIRHSYAANIYFLQVYKRYVIPYDAEQIYNTDRRHARILGNIHVAIARPENQLILFVHVT